jgi:pyroglutamyl-peptidase
MAAFAAELLPVDDARIGPRLSEIGSRFAPDVVVQFGLAASCRGFRLERVGRNGFSNAAPDNHGVRPGDGPICAGPPLLASTLPLEAIHDVLSAAGLPVGWSDDAGGYLCNMAMTLALAGACEGFRPRWSGFVHVPPVGRGAPLSGPDFRRGALLVVETVCAQWARREAGP